MDMVLQGDEEGLSPPFDASMYGRTRSPDTPIAEWDLEYAGCEGLGALFQTSPAVGAMLPEGVSLFSDPPQAGVLVLHYGSSPIGEYEELTVLIQVEDVDGEMAYYVPHIWTTTGASMAMGREMTGAPKKLGAIDVEHDDDMTVATLERPEGKRLCTLTAKPERRAGQELVDVLFAGPTPTLSVRHLPPVQGGDGVSQLVKWYTDMEFHEDATGGRKVWEGPIDVSYDSPTSLDPLHAIPVEETMVGIHFEFDMHLGATEVQIEWRH